MGSPIKISNFLAELCQGIGYPIEPEQFISIENAESLARLIGPKSFITITSLLDAKKSIIGGQNNLLGYTSKEYTLEKSIEIIPGVYGIIVFEYGKCIYEMLHRPDFIRKLDQHAVYSISYPAKHALGHLVKITRISKCLSCDEKGRMIKNINICLVQDLPMEPIICRPKLLHVSDDFYKAEQRELETIALPRITQSVIAYNKCKSILAKKELTIAELQAKGLSSSKIAYELDVTVNTINQHSKNIKRKIESLFEHAFPSSKEASFYLERLGFLNHPEQGNHWG